MSTFKKKKSKTNKLTLHLRELKKRDRKLEGKTNSMKLEVGSLKRSTHLKTFSYIDKKKTQITKIRNESRTLQLALQK